MPEQFEIEEPIKAEPEEEETFDRKQDRIDAKFSDDREKIEQEIEALAKEAAFSISQIKILLQEVRGNPEGEGRTQKEQKIWPRLNEINRKTDEVDKEWDAATHELKEVRRLEKEEKEN